jgi:hypothetical protein
METGRTSSAGPVHPEDALVTGLPQARNNLEDSVARHFLVYNFLVRHRMPGASPAHEAHATEQFWTFEKLVDLIDRAE